MTQRIAMVLISFGVVMPLFAHAQWTNPSQNPPSGNVPPATLATVTAGSGANVTSNGISVGSFINNGGSYFAGNIGIGQLSPSQKLDIASGGIGFSGTTGNALNASDKKLYSSADGDLEWYTNNAAGAHGFAVSNQGTKQVYLNTSGNSYFTGGNLGIGMIAPDQKLGVNGNIHVYNGGTSAGYVYSDGSNFGLLNNIGSWSLYMPNATSGASSIYIPASVYSGAFYYNSSDVRLKKNIAPLSDSLSKILSLQGVSFIWKDESKGKSANIGLIAQDVEKVYPELVATDASTGLKSIQYSNLVAPLIEAIKEQQKQVDAQGKLIESQQKEIETLKAAIHPAK